MMIKREKVKKAIMMMMMMMMKGHNSCAIQCI